MTELLMEGAVLTAMKTLLFCCRQGVQHLLVLFVTASLKLWHSGQFKYPWLHWALWILWFVKSALKLTSVLEAFDQGWGTYLFA